jgi:hypothetical protein
MKALEIIQTNDRVRESTLLRLPSSSTVSTVTTVSTLVSTLVSSTAVSTLASTISSTVATLVSSTGTAVSSLVNTDSAALELGVVHGIQGVGSIIVGRVTDEAESTGAASVTVLDDNLHIY